MEKVYWKVALPENPSKYYVEDNISTLIASMHLDALEDTEPQGFCITPICMTKEEFEALPEFDGF